MREELEKRKELAIRIAKEAGNILIENFRKPFKFKEKAEKQWVSDVDLKAEERIVKMIRREFPQDSILSEENTYKLSNSDFKWIIDPLDGTHNYIKGIDIFGVSIAFALGEEILAGVIYLPISDELYLAIRNKGAYKNGRRISVSKRNLSQATLIYDSSIRYRKEEMLSCLDKLADKVFNIRMFGSTVRSLSYIAEGKVDLEIEFNDKVWDFASGLLLVEEAKGKVTDLKGNRWNLNTKGYIASNRVIHKDVLRLIR
jgi:myo-inositol-1(or 4)-monophosphatase